MNSQIAAEETAPSSARTSRTSISENPALGRPPLQADLRRREARPREDHAEGLTLVEDAVAVAGRERGIVNRHGRGADHDRVSQGTQTVQADDVGGPRDVVRMPTFGRNATVNALTELRYRQLSVDPERQIELEDVPGFGRGRRRGLPLACRLDLQPEAGTGIMGKVHAGRWLRRGGSRRGADQFPRGLLIDEGSQGKLLSCNPTLACIKRSVVCSIFSGVVRSS